MLRVEASLAHGVAAVAIVVAELAVAGASRHQVIAVVALVAQVAIRAVTHRSIPISPNADASATAGSEARADAGGSRLQCLVRR